MSIQAPICAEDAYYCALQIKQKVWHVGYTSLEELAQIILRSEDLVYLYAWGHNIGTHLDEMEQTLAASNDVNVMALWCLHVRSTHNIHIKLRVLELGKVDEFVDTMDAFSGRKIDYSLDAFYSDLPLEARTGVLV